MPLFGKKKPHNGSPATNSHSTADPLFAPPEMDFTIDLGSVNEIPEQGDLTEDDLKDMALLKELEEAGWQSDDDTTHLSAEKASSSSATVTPTKTRTTPPLPASQTSSPPSHQKDGRSELHAIRTAIDTKRGEATALNTVGRVDEARAAMREAKQMEVALKGPSTAQAARVPMAQAHPQNQPETIKKAAESPKAAPKIPPKTTVESPKAAPKIPPKTTAESPKAAPKIPPKTTVESPKAATSTPKAVAVPMTPPKATNPAVISALQARVTEFKQAALRYKGQGDLASAKYFLVGGKRVEEFIARAQRGETFDMASVPSLRGYENEAARYQKTAKHDTVLLQSAPPPSSAVSVTITSAGSQECAPENVEELFQWLEHTLRKQMDVLKAHSQMALEFGDERVATELAKQSEAQEHQLGLLKITQARNPTAAPAFHIERRKYVLTQRFGSIRDNEIEIGIIQCHNLKNSGGRQTYVQFEFGWPADEPQSGKTPVCDDSGQWNYTHKLTIDRNRKTFQKFIAKKKISFEVIRAGTWLKSDKVLGGFDLPLSDLERKAELRSSCEVLKDRKPIAAQVDVCIRMRHPLVGREQKELEEQFLVIESFGGGEHVVTCTPQSPGASSSPAPRTRSSSGTEKKPRKNTREAVPPPPSQSSSEKEKATLDPHDDPNSVENVVSYEVMEWELENIAQKIAALAAAGKRPSAEIEERKMELEAKKKILEIEITNGTLSMADYAAMLQEKITEEKKRALAWKASRKDWAILALRRAKIMMKELEASEEEEPC